MSFQLGQVIGDYEFVDVLRSSKTNVAYKVKNVLAQRFETLKIVPGDLHHDPERLERFQREIKIHARLDHPNILAFYNASVLNGNLVMTTAFVEGTTLEERLELGPLPWREALGYASQVLAALTAAHAQGIVHRELTPANVLLNSDGKAILTGFGQAKAAQDPKLTQKGAVIGSLFYMSPEQVRGGEQVDARSDLYSLGAVLFEMVTGQRMFIGKSHFDIMVAHVNQAPPNPAALAPDLPAEVAALILRCVSKAPEQRHGTAAELRTDLLVLLDGQDATPVAPQSAKAPVATKIEAMPKVEVALAPVAAGPAAASPEAPPARPVAPPSAENLPDMGAEFANSDRKALVVLVCTLVFLLISTVMMAKLG